MTNNNVEIKNLKIAILNLHKSKSKWLESIPIKEMFGDKVVWEGIVQVFELMGHPTAKKCYAWSHEIEGSTKRKFYAVLHEGPVDTPVEAVRASIISNKKAKIV